jgi:1,4-dihydroxy-2-naphthoate octaprenyltransferase
MVKVWIQAARPKTLWAAVAPVVMGSAMAAADGAFHGPSAALALLGALLIQVGTNYCNDYGDFRKGADTLARVGPVRATQAGLVSPTAMLWATVLVFALTALVAILLSLRAGWPVLVVGAASILSGVVYTAGPRPLAYVGLGDLFVLFFFGPVAVGGTYFVQARAWSSEAALAGLAAGLLSCAILTVNNLRDVETDRVAGKRTLAVRFGKNFSRGEYVACVVLALLVPVALWLATGRAGGLLGCLAVLPAVPAVLGVLRNDGAALNPYLGRTGLVLLLFGLLFSAGWWLL